MTYNYDETFGVANVEPPFGGVPLGREWGRIEVLGA